MKHAREIIIAPLFTEKSTGLKENRNVYTFEVSINANKIEIQKAIEAIFDVDVLNVNTIKCKGKPRNYGQWSGFRSSWKKAYVTVKDGQTIADFEN